MAGRLWPTPPERAIHAEPDTRPRNAGRHRSSGCRNGPAEKIILFGSAARGELGPNSDIDLLVVKDEEDTRGLEARIHRELRGVRVAVDAVVVSPMHVERYKDSHALIANPALRDGTVVYEAV